MVREVVASGQPWTASLTEYFPAGTSDRSSTTDLGERTPDAPFSCQRILRGVGFGAIRSARKARLKKPASTGVIVSEIGSELSAGAFPYSSQNNPICFPCE